MKKFHREDAKFAKKDLRKMEKIRWEMRLYGAGDGLGVLLRGLRVSAVKALSHGI